MYKRQALFAIGFNDRYAPYGVNANAVMPGGIMTPLQRYLPREEMIAFGWMDETGKVDERFKTTEQGAATSVWAGTSPQLEGKGGVYCEDCDVAKITQPGESRISGVNPHAIDPEAARRLWQVSVEYTGLDAF